MAKLSSVERMRRAVRELDDTQFDLIGYAERYTDDGNSHERAARRRELLSKARGYAAAIRRLAQVRS